MDWIVKAPEKSLATTAAPGALARGVTLATSAVPWLIIAGLLWAGLFIKPQPVGSTIEPGAVERRDRFYGIGQKPNGELWLAGSAGKLIRLSASGGIARANSTSNESLQDVAFWDDSRGIAVGNGAVVVVTKDGGKTWSAVSNVPKSEVANKLTRVRLGGAGTAVAVGEMGALLTSSDNGDHWERARPEEDQAWNDAAILADGTVIAVGEFGRIAIRRKGENGWTDIKAPSLSSLMSVSFRDERNGVAVGLDGVLIVTRDGGKSWRALTTETSDHLFDVTWEKSSRTWFSTGALGRWIRLSQDMGEVQKGRLDKSDLSWHTKSISTKSGILVAGANVARWDGVSLTSIGTASE